VHKGLSDQRTNVLAMSVESHGRAGESCQERRAGRQNAEARLKLFFCLRNFVHSKQGEAIAHARTSIVWKGMHRVPMKGQRILPDVIVADAEQNGGSYEPTRNNTAYSPIVYSCPC